MNESPTGVAYDPLTENYLLGALLADPGRIWDARMVVRSTDFASTANAFVWDAMCDVADSGQLATAVAVTNRLQQAHGTLVSPAYVHALVDPNLYGYQVGEYAGYVRQHGERVELLDASAAIGEIARQGLADQGDLLERAAGILEKLRGAALRLTRPIGEAWGDLIKGLRSETPYTPTPWLSLNSIIQGVRPGCLYTVAAGSGGGKSVFGLQLALHVAELGGRVGYVSLEMTELDLLKRLVSMSKGIHQNAIQNNQLTEDAMHELLSAETGVKALPLEVFDKPAATWEEITAFARALHRKGGLRLLVIDYFGMVKSQPGSRSRQQDLEDWANGAKALAKELGCAVVLLEQVNRDAKDRKDPRPVVTDLRGTAALEHAADAVILLYRPKQRKAGKDYDTKFIEFIVVKNRNGEPGVKKLLFEGQFARIRQLEHEHTPLLGHEQF